MQLRKEMDTAKEAEKGTKKETLKEAEPGAGIEAETGATAEIEIGTRVTKEKDKKTEFRWFRGSSSSSRDQDRRGSTDDRRSRRNNSKPDHTKEDGSVVETGSSHLGLGANEDLFASYRPRNNLAIGQRISVLLRAIATN
ncbi:hypothetical protein Pelo_1180 [Pelomyxa schiedti]|nr:hypothetical protein Pelo_1180 [Pelomyxa schiedti]